MVFPAFLRRLAHAALAAGAGAVLTLCVFNIYPNLAHGQEGDWLEISQVFDFQVPEEIIASGVSNGNVSVFFDENTKFAQVVESVMGEPLDESLVGALLETNWSSSLDWLHNHGLNTNNLSYNGSSWISDGMRSSDYTTNALRMASSGDEAVSRLFHGNDVPFFAVPNLEGVTDLFSTDELPAVSAFDSANPLLQGLTPPAGWFSSGSISGSQVYQDIFGPFESEIDNISNFQFQGVSVFSYIPDVLDFVSDAVATMLSDDRVWLRRIVGLACAFLNVVLVFRWWLWRIYRVFAVVTGNDAMLNSDVAKPSED